MLPVASLCMELQQHSVLAPPSDVEASFIDPSFKQPLDPPSSASCNDHQPIKLKPSNEFQFLSSHWMRIDRLSHCSFKITADPGQKIVFSIIDFSDLPSHNHRHLSFQSTHRYSNNHFSANNSNNNKQLQHCSIYATLVQHNNKHHVSVCHNDTQLHRQATTTHDNVAVVRFVNHVVNDPSIFFLAKFRGDEGLHASGNI